MLELWLNAFLLTLVLEMPIYFYFIKGKTWERLFLSFAPTALAHPPLWFILPWGQYDFIFLFITGELLVVLFEGSFFKLMNVKNAFKLALGVNFISATLPFLWT
jgi:hypothetical protein